MDEEQKERYRQLYKKGKSFLVYGNTILWIGIGLGILVSLVILVSVIPELIHSNNEHSREIILLLLPGIILAGLGYLIQSLLTAQGLLMLTAFDTAVRTAQLTNTLRKNDIIVDDETPSD